MSSPFIVTQDSLDMGFLTAFKASPMTRKTCVGLPQMYLKIIELPRFDLRHLSFDQAMYILLASHFDGLRSDQCNILRSDLWNSLGLSASLLDSLCSDRFWASLVTLRHWVRL